MELQLRSHWIPPRLREEEFLIDKRSIFQTVGEGMVSCVRYLLPCTYFYRWPDCSHFCFGTGLIRSSFFWRGVQDSWEDRRE